MTNTASRNNYLDSLTQNGYRDGFAGKSQPVQPWLTRPQASAYAIGYYAGKSRRDDQAAE